MVLDNNFVFDNESRRTAADIEIIWALAGVLNPAVRVPVSSDAASRSGLCLASVFRLCGSRNCG